MDETCPVDRTFSCREDTRRASRSERRQHFADEAPLAGSSLSAIRAHGDPHDHQPLEGRCSRMLRRLWTRQRWNRASGLATGRDLTIPVRSPIALICSRAPSRPACKDQRDTRSPPRAALLGESSAVTGGAHEQDSNPVGARDRRSLRRFNPRALPAPRCAPAGELGLERADRPGSQVARDHLQ